MYYDESKGYGLQFDGKWVLYRDKKEDLIRLADGILKAVVDFSLLAELNKMQIKAGAYGDYKEGDPIIPNVFNNKFEIPSYFINLILKDYKMKVLGW